MPESWTTLRDENGGYIQCEIQYIYYPSVFDGIYEEMIMNHQEPDSASRWTLVPNDPMRTALG